MATNNGNGMADRPNPEKEICKCITTMTSERNSALSLKEAGMTTMSSMNEVRKYKLCCLDKTKDTHNTYQNLNNYVCIQQNLKTELLVADIDGYLAKDKELEKLIKESSKLLSDLKTKIEEAHNACCTMKNCISNKLLPKDGEDLPPNLQEIQDCYKDICSKTEKINNYGQKSFDDIVTIAGIHTFSNVESLKDFGSKLSETMGNFKTSVDTNIKTAEGDLKVAQDELTTALTDLTNSKHDKDGHCIKAKGLNTTLEFLCKGECNLEDTVEEFCKKVASDDKDGAGSKKRKSYHSGDKD
jgi:hypothetical protein